MCRINGFVYFSDVVYKAVPVRGYQSTGSTKLLTVFDWVIVKVSELIFWFVLLSCYRELNEDMKREAQKELQQVRSRGTG